MMLSQPREAAAATDEELLLAYTRTRNREALSALVERCWPEAYRLALRSFGDPASAEDVAQDALVALVRGAHRFKDDRSFGPWFRTIVLNTIRNDARSRSRRRLVENRGGEAQALALAERAPAHEGEQRVIATELAEHVRRLPEDVRFAVVLHFEEGRPHEDVAEALQGPKGTASSRIRRGLEQLRDSLAAVGYAAAIPELTQLLSEEAGRGAGAIPPPPLAGSVEFAAAKAATIALLMKIAAATLIVLLAVLVLVQRWDAETLRLAASPAERSWAITVVAVDKHTGRPLEGAWLEVLSRGDSRPRRADSGRSGPDGIVRSMPLDLSGSRGRIVANDGRRSAEFDVPGPHGSTVLTIRVP
jgi:RNA polymerase sigma-70 factor (ECF subfamily)